jgi:glc operon protein GlcG
MLNTQVIDYEEARRIIAEISKEAAQMQKSAVIAVADAHGELIAFARMNGAPVSSIRIAMNKAWTAARERKPTEEIGKRARHPENGFDIAYFGDPRFVGWGGGVPVWRHGSVVGAVAVSGLPQSEDIRLATMGASLVSGEESAA